MSYATPQPGASLLLAFSPASTQARRTVLLIGQNRLAAARAFSCLEAGLRVVLATSNQSSAIDPELQERVELRQVETVPLPQSSTIQTDGHSESDSKIWLDWLLSLPEELLDDVQLVCCTDTIHTAAAPSAPSTSYIHAPRSQSSALAIRQACYKLRLPINVADHPTLSDFHFPATYRFPLLSTSSPLSSSPLQLAITTNASSCRLASRIRREIVTKLPKGIGSAVAQIGKLRQMAREADQALQSDNAVYDDEEEREEGWSTAVLNKPVPQILSLPSKSRCTAPNRRHLSFSSPLVQASHIPLTPPATPPAVSVANKMDEILAGQAPELAPSRLTRMRFIAQISEYWPIERIATLSDAEAARVINLYSRQAGEGRPADLGQVASSESGSGIPANGTNQSDRSTPSDNRAGESRHGLALAAANNAIPQKRGRIYLLGSGPGSPALLTRAAHALLTQHATLILSDKLVPSEVLALIPKHIPLTIAKKFPGNAEGAQNELMDLAYEGALRGETVVRLKQGDPYVYGRGGEEVLFFRERGFEAVVVPGISSAFAAPLMAGIPVTQRGVSESVVVCTGVGRKGKGVKLPGYERARTTVVLMGVARLPGVIQALTSQIGEEGHGREGGARDGPAYPLYCPIAIVEKASSPDQRMVASTLEGIVDAMERAGEQRPPGMMIIGWSALALEGKGDVEVLDGIDDLSAEELENIDRARVKRWLGPKGYIVREGLDTNWNDLFDREDEQIREIATV